MPIIDKNKKIETKTAKKKKNHQNKHKRNKFLEEDAGFIIDIEG